MKMIYERDWLRFKAAERFAEKYREIQESKRGPSDNSYIGVVEATIDKRNATDKAYNEYIEEIAKIDKAHAGGDKSYPGWN